MPSNSSGTVTTINTSYLKNLVEFLLQPLLDDVNKLLQNGQMEKLPGTSSSIEIPQIDGTLTVPAGGSNFQPAADLVNALSAVGSSVNSDLNWFQQALSETIDEIHTTVASMKSTDDLNAEQAQTLQQDFAGAISAIGSSPTGGAGSSGGSGGSGGSGSSGGSGGGSSSGGGSGSGSGSSSGSGSGGSGGNSGNSGSNG
jgi:hypothetical protein